jgi:hypothetical protein
VIKIGPEQEAMKGGSSILAGAFLTETVLLFKKSFGLIAFGLSLFGRAMRRLLVLLSSIDCC